MPIMPIVMRLLGAAAPKTVDGTIVGIAMATPKAAVPLNMNCTTCQCNFLGHISYLLLVSNEATVHPIGQPALGPDSCHA